MNKLTSTRAVRAAFWRDNPTLKRRKTAYKGRIITAPQNMQPCDTRMAFVDYIDRLQRDGIISDRLAQSITL